MKRSSYRVMFQTLLETLTYQLVSRNPTNNQNRHVDTRAAKAFNSNIFSKVLAIQRNTAKARTSGEATFLLSKHGQGHCKARRRNTPVPLPQKEPQRRSSLWCLLCQSSPTRVPLERIILAQLQSGPLTDPALRSVVPPIRCTSKPAGFL